MKAVNEYRRCATSLEVREMHIKTRTTTAKVISASKKKGPLRDQGSLEKWFQVWGRDSAQGAWNIMFMAESKKAFTD